MAQRPGPVVLFGSGETSPSGRKVYEWIFARLPPPVRVAVLETPAGFQPNSAAVAGKVANFLVDRLRNYRPEVAVIPARRHGSPFSPDDPALLAPMLQAGALFLGPGSPTYTVRQLADSLAWEYLKARHRLGSAVLLASAATIAAGAHCLPVYEIYKVGADPYWHPGLDLFGPCGLSLVFIPHWDDAEGGVELDTSRCFMGRDRFGQLLSLLPPGPTVVGIDEHTALVVDLEISGCRVMGRGGITLLRSGGETRYSAGRTFSIGELGPFRLPAPEEGISGDAWAMAVAAQEEPPALEGPPPDVLALVRQRESARSTRDWSTADAVRGRIAELGWRILDTPEGPVLERIR